MSESVLPESNEDNMRFMAADINFNDVEVQLYPIAQPHSLPI